MNVIYVDSSKARAEFFDIMRAVYNEGKVFAVKKSGVPMVTISAYDKSQVKKDFSIYRGILSDDEADKMLELVKKGRKDGSGKKKYLLNW